MSSPTGMWTSVSGGMAQSQNIDTIANNIANANTVAFKKDEATFKEYLTSVEHPPDPAIDIPRTIFKDSDFYHFDGRENAMVNLDQVHTDQTAGSLKMTNSSFDLAIDGPGYFAIRTPQGMMFTRAGDFKMDAKGQLVTSEGYPVLGTGAAAGAAPGAAPGVAPTPGGATDQTNSATQASVENPFAIEERSPAGVQGQPPKPSALQPIILASASSKILIDGNGKVFSGEDLLGSIAVAEFPDTNKLRKIGSNLFLNEGGPNVPVLAKQSRVRQGFLEQSNVNVVSEMVNLIKANRSYEGNMRAIRTYNDMAGKEANEVGKL